MERKTEQIGIESLIKHTNNEFDSIAEIYVCHLVSASDVDQLVITVHTGEAESFEQFVTVASAEKVMIDVGEADPLTLPYDVIATVDGPGHMQDTEGTSVYVAENVEGAKSRELEDGLRMLRQKLAGVCPSCDDEIETFRDHYRDSQECREAERV
ncbi:hypothetical protein [Haloquadratum walsbyi]|jgi:hypothetical protein|uniref:Uncharacterized protein n=1 Tax=Haloquadratum walsbyi (strain DSM 16854 / JCM 12705 / C23) TaxID=768065 RepID=G0LN11_HALWC|nr:hypothetical protein [Haloquadratum walsbyi]CCC41481.1 uncharacterized protein Hqrw_3743 [Haloquadratum walsbyi C23]